MPVLALALVLALQPVMATEAAAPPETTAASTSTTSTTPSTTTSTTAAPLPASQWQKSVGVGLVAGGAGVACAGIATVTLIEALTTPDREGNPKAENVEFFSQTAGFGVAAATALSAVAIVVGAALLLIDEAPAPAPAPPPAP
jgi:hypothetical protein